MLPSLVIENLRGAIVGPIDLTVASGACAAITGPSGAGKSLLLRMIADLDPCEGEVALGDVRRATVPAPVWRARAMHVAAEAGWWAERADAHFPADVRATARDLAGQLGLVADVLERQVRTLSTGERQRLALVRALVRRPACLLLDEPTSALDPASIDKAEALLGEAMAAGTIIVLVSHDAAQAQRLATARYVMQAGRLEPSMKTILLTPWDLAIAAALVVLDAALSFALRLDLHKRIAVATVRLVVQLVAIGYVLRFVFALNSPAATLAIAALMVLVAGREVAARPERRLARRGNLVVGATSVALATTLTAVLALTTAIRPDPWYDPRYALPLTGIILGNVLNAGSITLDAIIAGFPRERTAIEARLALGDTFADATRPIVVDAIRLGMVPIINQMSAAGIITLPGIMTGQILAGLDPLEAVKYQILLMFLLAGACGLVAVSIALLAARRFTDERQRLRLDRLE